MMFLMRLLSFPLELIKSPAQFISGIWQDGGRGQYLVLGMPAVIFFLIAITALGLAYSNDNSATYKRLADIALQREVQLESDLKGLAAPLPAAENGEPSLKDQWLAELNKEKLFLNKLIEIDPDDPEHKYNRAENALREGNQSECEALMQVIAPFDKAGYAKAHVFLAKYYLKRIQQSQANREEDLKRAEKQVDNALIADESNLEAKRLKGRVLFEKRQPELAYQVFEKLFEDDPIYYRELLLLAVALKKTDAQKDILDRAARGFRQKLNLGIDNVQDWVQIWEQYAECMKSMKEFGKIETALKSELERFRGDLGKEIFLKKQLSMVYAERAASLGRDGDLATQEAQLADLDRALQNDPKNVSAMYWLTILGNGDSVAEQARKIYDPRKDPNASWDTLAELGSDALERKDYDEAILYFKRARNKQPRVPLILNNLAYAYLVAANKDPEQALLLADQAITIYTKSQFSDKNVIASFYDTRGLALMQLNRMGDAIAALEVAKNYRPNSEQIMERLIECYTATGNEKQVETLRRELQRQKKESSDNADGNRG